MNHKKRNDNTSGFTGICFDKRRNKWTVRISLNKKTIWLGEFKNKKNAIKARKEAEMKHFGEFQYKGK